VLVLGVGGIVGEAWMWGYLGGAQRSSGEDWRRAKQLIGTSAGSIVAAALVGGMAPDARLVVYNLPSATDEAFMTGFTDVVEDNRVDIVSTSYGLCEDFYSPAYAKVFNSAGYGVLDRFDDLFRQGNAQGITFVNASGDNGALDCVSLANITTPPQEPPHVAGKATVGVDSWASSPHVTGVGGTNLVTVHVPGSLDSAYVRENARAEPLLPVDLFGTGNLVANAVWGSGGGFSKHFPAPAYQKGLTGSRFRAVPDLAMHMGGCSADAPQPCKGELSSDVVAFNGELTAAIGTSLAGPDFAGALALQEEALGGKRLGNINPRLYALAAKNKTGHYFHQNIPGNNGGFNAGPGYNEVLGNGTPIVKNLIGLPNDPGAGVPHTPSNP
jgi:subtilase family serine protease